MNIKPHAYRRATQESAMHRRVTLRALVATLSLGTVVSMAAGCTSLVGADQGSVTITEAVLPLVLSEDCDNNGDGQAIANGVLDISLDTGYFAALRVRTNLPSTINTQTLQQGGNYPYYGNGDANIVSFGNAEVYLEDGDVADLRFDITNPQPPWELDQNADIAGLPSKAVPRVSAASGVVFNEQQGLGNSTLVYVSAITPQEANTLANGVLGAELTDPTDRKLVIASVTLNGSTSGAAPVRSNTFSYPIYLCRGCLTPTCNPGEDIVPGDSCSLVGQDLPAQCESTN